MPVSELWMPAFSVLPVFIYQKLLYLQTIYYFCLLAYNVYKMFTVSAQNLKKTGCSF